MERSFRRLLDPTESGLGRVMFAPVGDGEVRVFSFQLPVVDQVVLEPTAYVRPLVNTVEAAPPAGIVVVCRDGLRVIDYRYGMVEDIGRSSYGVGVEDWRDMRGPAPSEFSQQGVSHRERFASRVEDNLARLLRADAPQLGAHAAGRGWTTLVLVGDVQLTGVLAGELSGDVIQIDAVVDPLSSVKIVEYVGPQLKAARTRYGAGLANRAKDAALAGGRGVLGLRDTLHALNESRVANLLLDESREWSGSRTDYGMLHLPGEIPPGESEKTLVPESAMGERMIERALDIDAEVTVLDREASRILADYDGVAAIMRW
ncbi:VLRF1 family aeRF1-type release factor [Streptosporangium lutulentum]